MASHAVEFVGGPLDGFVQTFRHSPDRLPPETGIPLNPTLLRFLFQGGRKEQVRGAATSVAVYELCREAGELRYFHQGSLAEREYEPQNARA